MSNELNAAALPSMLQTIGGEPLVIEAAAGDAPNTPKRFNAIAYTGGVMNLRGFMTPVVVDLAGVKVPNQKAPVLRDHDQAKPLGHSETIEVTAQRIKVAGVLSGVGLEVDQVTALAANGYPWQTSIGTTIDKVEYVDRGQSAKVNGRNFPGPVTIVRDSTWRELTLCTLGADSNTSATIAASLTEGDPMTFSEWLKSKNIDEANTPADTLNVLRASYKLEQSPAPTPTKPGTGMPQTVEAVAEEARANNLRLEAIAAAVRKAVKACPTKVNDFEEIGVQARESNWDLDRLETRLLVASVSQSAPLVYSKSRGDTSPIVLECALSKAMNLQTREKQYDERTLEAAETAFDGDITLHEFIGLCAQQFGFRGTVKAGNIDEALRTAYRGELRASGPSTYNISGILSSTLRKSIHEHFNFVEREWPKFCAIGSVTDFKEITRYSLVGGTRYEKVPPGGEIKRAKLSESSTSNQIDTYGGALGLDRRDLINDDAGALGRVGKMLGRGGGLAINECIYGVITDNVDPDGNTFFSTGNGNYDEGTDTTFSNDGLVAADILWAARSGPDEKPLGHVARKLLLPWALRIPALRLMSSQSFGSADEEGTDNPWAGQFEVIASRYLAASPKVWYMLCDQNDVPFIEIAFLNGKQEPTVTSVDMPTGRLGLDVVSYHDFGAALQETTGAMKFKGEA